VVLAVATCAGAGLVPAIPGTCGAALGVALFLLFAPAPLWLLALSWLSLLALGTWAADVAGRLYEREDDARIVIDEVVGQLLALSPLLTPLLDANYWSVATAFVLFRSFDIGKMGPVGWVERRVRGGLGVNLAGAGPLLWPFPAAARAFAARHSRFLCRAGPSHAAFQ